jgi:hypothetical protein
MKAIITYTDHYSIYPEYPIFSKIEFTVENILKLRNTVQQRLIITDLTDYYYWDCYTGELEDYDSDDVIYKYLTSFTEEELQDMAKNPENYIVIEIYDGYRE